MPCLKARCGSSFGHGRSDSHCHVWSGRQPAGLPAACPVLPPELG